MENTIFDCYKFDKLEIYPDKYISLINAIDENYSIYKLGIYKSNLSEGIFIHARIDISIPTNGVYRQLDIHSKEDIMIYAKTNYPWTAPSVLFVRNDFPTSQIPHLNLGVSDSKIKMLNTCLYRGNIDEWFYLNGPKVFCDRVNEWFFDLVNGNLIKEDGFEVLRNENSKGIVEVDYEYLFDKILGYNRDYGAILLQAKENNERYFKVLNYEYTNNLSENIIPCIFIFDKKSVVSEYSNHNFNKEFDLNRYPCERRLKFGIEKLRRIIGKTSKLNQIKEILVILAVKRPMQVIGNFSEYEYLSVIMVYDFNSKNCLSNYPIERLSVIQSINSDTLERLSKTQEIDKKTIVMLGCGALGSKISMHLARMGYTKQHLYDNDLFLPHNLARHSIVSNSLVGYPKAFIIAEQIKSLVSSNECRGYYEDIFNIKKLSDGIVVDCTASKRSLYWSVSSGVINFPMVRTEIYFGGKVGLTLIEGKKRNPDVHDIMISLYMMALENNIISQWLNYQDFEDSIYNIGFGCSSDTMILDDSTISNHASIVPHLINKRDKFKNGMACLSYFDNESLNKNSTYLYEIESMKVFQNVDGWSIRIRQSLYEKIVNYTKENLENAGLWMGRIEKSINRITIIDTFIPKDNIRNIDTVTVGKEEVELYLKKVSKKTNGLIEYIGEWHTHISGTALPSQRDLNTFNEVKKNTSVFLMTIMSPLEVNNIVINGDE